MGLDFSLTREQEKFRQQMAQLTRTLGNAEPTPEQRRAAAAAALDQLIAQAALAGEIERLGIAVPNDAVVREINGMAEFRLGRGRRDQFIGRSKSLL